MKNYQTPRVELLELLSQDILTASSLNNVYNDNGTEIDKISWNNLF